MSKKKAPLQLSQGEVVYIRRGCAYCSAPIGADDEWVDAIRNGERFVACCLLHAQLIVFTGKGRTRLLDGRLAGGF